MDTEEKIKKLEEEVNALKGTFVKFEKNGAIRDGGDWNGSPLVYWGGASLIKGQQQRGQYEDPRLSGPNGRPGILMAQKPFQ